MGRSVDHLVADCYPGQLSPYLNISTLKASPPLLAALIHSKPSQKQKKKTQQNRNLGSSDKYKTSKDQ